MDREKARKILSGWITPTGGLYDLHQYINWDIGDKDATLDGLFNVKELEAVAWWMRNIKEEGEKDV